ncbi:HdeD family acid-resistance protein [Actinomadura fibrosa]|uniref:HdeD family acid-resistance protein n=1 Tax=Actinomadura fibrosa TaxID=111802 RepID=A0ABW2XRW2_9ACTN|nr:DUF308 domain-containing protein [Actinomadura fibrosa]
MSSTSPSTGAGTAAGATGTAASPAADRTLLTRLTEGGYALALTVGAVSLLLGIVIVTWPEATIGVVAVLFGVQLIVSGIVRLAQAVVADAGGGARVLFAILGVLSIAIGVLALRHLLQTVTVMALLFGLFWLIGGLIEFFVVLSDKERPGRNGALAFAVFSALAGVVVLAYPDITLVALTWVLGLWLITWGILGIGLTLWIRHAEKKAAEQGRPA